MKPPKTYSREKHALIARAKEQGASYFFIKRPTPKELLERAIEDFPMLPYAYVWEVYRYFFRKKYLDKRSEYAILKKTRGFTRRKRFSKG